MSEYRPILNPDDLWNRQAPAHLCKVSQREVTGLVAGFYSSRHLLMPVVWFNQCPIVLYPLWVGLDK
jgi:hypothetical protein